LTEKDVEDFVALTKNSILELQAFLPEALSHLEAHRYAGDLNDLFKEEGEAHE